MMTEIRHNFTQNSSLTAQLIEFMRAHIGKHSDNPQSIVEKRKWASKAWHSSTYEGRVHNYIFRVSSDEIAQDRKQNDTRQNNVRQNIDYSALNTALAAHEFMLRKSFVAAIEIKSIEGKASYSDIAIEAIIIFEE